MWKLHCQVWVTKIKPRCLVDGYEDAQVVEALLFSLVPAGNDQVWIGALGDVPYANALPLLKLLRVQRDVDLSEGSRFGLHVHASRSILVT